MDKNSLKKFRQSIRTGFDNFQKIRKGWEKPAEEKRMKLPRNPIDHKGKKIVIELSLSNVARAIAIAVIVLVPFYFISQIGDILVIFFVSFLCAAALDPIVDYFDKKRVPRSVSILLIYFVVFVVLGLLIASLIPLIAKQVGDIALNLGTLVQNLNRGNIDYPFAERLTPYIQQFFRTIDIQTLTSQAQTTLQVVANQLLNISLGFMNVLLVLVLTFFMTVEEKSMEDFSLSLFPSRYGHYISARLEAIKEKVGYWLRGQLLVSLAAAILSYVGLVILGIEYALTLAIISGIAMIIPIFGRVIAWLFVLPVALGQSPIIAFWISMYYLFVQQIENNALVPYIMNRVVGLSPIVIIFAMLVGFKFLNIPGLIIAIPIATMVAIFIKDYTEREK